MAQYLLCYRSSLFRGFSIVSATLLNGDQQRGDHDGDLNIQTTDPNSLVATCGKSQWDAGHATGISNPNLWGHGLKSPLFNKLLPVFTRVTKPIVLFAGDKEVFLSVQDIDDTTAEIISRNNLDPVAISLGINTLFDNSTTDFSEFNLPVNVLESSSIFTMYKVTRTDDNKTILLSAAHAMPDANELDNPFMTRDYNYTDKTINFFETHADLNLNP
jgi:hypothetical protein